MTVPKRYLKILIIAVLLGLVVFSVLALILKIFYAGFDPTSYITAISLLAIAVLTIVYALMASSQLDVMKKQLSEMHETRQLESQPLTVLELSRISLEPPRVFYKPAEDDHAFHARVRIQFSLKNHTLYPSVNIAAAGVIALDGNKKKSSLMRSKPVQLDILSSNKTYPDEEHEDHPEFIFFADKEDDLLSRLQKKTAALLPVLNGRIIYRNILGACFGVDIAFRLIPAKQEDEETLKNWQALIVSFPVEYREQLEKMTALKKEKNETQWKRQRTTLEKEIAEKTGEEDLEISWERLPGSFKVRSVSPEEYREFNPDM